MKINKITVIGGGLMGRQIALNTAIHGIDATVYDLNADVCAAVEAWAEEYLEGRIKKGRMTEEKVEEIKKLFHVEAHLPKAVEGSDLIIEAIVEIEAVKAKLFQELNTLVGEDVIIATNTSFMLSSSFKDCVKNPGRLLNMHYYNPALVMKLVELMQGDHTSEETVQACYDFCLKTGKMPIRIRKELPGYIGSRFNKLMSREAKRLVANGYLTPQEVDIACEQGLGHPMGIFRLNDLTGINLTFDIMREEYEKTGVKPDMYDVYEQMVNEGRLGRSTGHGFYDYE